MTGRQDLFDESMRLGHSAAWDLEWDRAIEFYRKALAEFPENPAALTSLGLALFETEQFKEALTVYHNASELAPDDPIPVEKGAEIFEQLGQIQDAVIKRQAAAELYLQRKDADKAIENWIHIARMSPEDLGTRSRLAVTFERVGRQKEAVYEYLAVASILQKSDKIDRATEAVQRALRIIPGEAEAAKALRLIQQNKPLSPPPQPRTVTSPLKAEAVKKFLKAEADEPAGEEEFEQSDPESSAQTIALTILAGLLFDEPGSDEGEEIESPGMSDLTKGKISQEREVIGQPQMFRYLGQAIDLQTRGHDRQAVKEYQRAIRAGLDHPAAHYNLGLLLKNLEDNEGAFKHLSSSLGHPDLDLGANLALGRLARMREDLPEAARHLVQALRVADSMSVDESQSSQLGQLYDTILASQNDGDEEQLSQIVENTLSFLSGPEWLNRLRQARKQLEGQSEGTTIIPIAEMLAVGGTELILQSLSRIDDLIGGKKYIAAMEESMMALDYIPTYLGLHLRMAEIMILNNNIEGGMEKLETVAKTHQVRGEIPQATDVLFRIIRHSPVDLSARRRLIDLLAQQDRSEEALEHYMELAELYRQLADTEAARTTLTDALNLAQRSASNKEASLKILEMMGDIDLSHLDWRKALRAYEQICSLDPANEKARSHVIDLNLRLGQENQAATELDKQLEHLVQTGRGSEALTLLEELAREYPGKQALHSRLAEAYRAANRTADAIAQYDALGEIQLDAGQIPEAIRTIQTILELDPPDIEGYHELLRNLEDRE